MSLVLQWQLVKTGRCPQHVELANHLGQKKEKCHGHVVTSALTQEQKNVPTWRTCRECCALLPLRQRCWSILLCSAPVNRNVFQITIQRKLPILWPHLPDEERTNVKSHSVWCDGGQSTERETMSRMDGWYQGGPAHIEMEGNRPGWVAEGC